MPPSFGGVVGPLRMFGRLGLYAKMNYFFLIGIRAPPSLDPLSDVSEKNWIRLINMPIIISGPPSMPLATAVNTICWITVRVFFNIYVFRRLGTLMGCGGGAWIWTIIVLSLVVQLLQTSRVKLAAYVRGGRDLQTLASHGHRPVVS
ncbi:hypothetical protein NL676_013448 [Syzygium grande]|nr:hypothetical protein NL676_013448 [Syzygium grande]